MNTDKFTLFVYCNFLDLLTTIGCSQNINKQNANKADETLTDYSFLSRYHYTKSKNYLKRRYRIRHWIPMSFGTPCSIKRIEAILLFYKKRSERKPDMKPIDRSQGPAQLHTALIQPILSAHSLLYPCFRFHAISTNKTGF